MREARETLQDAILERLGIPTTDADINAILTALSSAGIDCEGWRDIESAPKDGTVIDLWAHNLLTWNKRGERHVNKKWGPVSDWAGREFEGWNLSGENYEVTHWRPLPLPPLASGGG